MTRGGVETDLEHSPYVLYKGAFTLYFSSKFYMDKYNEAIGIFTKSLELTFKKRYKISVCNVYQLAIVLLYMRIEKRGFYIELHDFPCKSIDDVPFIIKGGVS